MIWLLKLWPIVKSNYKIIVFTILIIIILYLFLHGRYETRRANDAEDGRNAAIKISNGLSNDNKKYRNKQGDTVIITRVIGIPKSQVDALLKDKDLQWIKKLEGVKKNGSNLESALTLSSDFDLSEVPEKIKYLPCKNDSLKIHEFNFHNQWNDIQALMADSSKIEIRDRLYAAIELKRPKNWFWKFQWSKREAFGEITNSNKFIKIDSAAVIRIIP